MNKMLIEYIYIEIDLRISIREEFYSIHNKCRPRHVVLSAEHVPQPGRMLRSLYLYEKQQMDLLVKRKTYLWRNR